MDDPPYVGKNWVSEALKNPIFYELISWRKKQTRMPQYNGSAPSLYSFGRNSSVHGPEKTKLDQHPLVQGTGSGSLLEFAGQVWGWVWKNATGQWHWPSVPANADPLWRRGWNGVQIPALAPVGMRSKKNESQKLQCSNDVELMIQKGFGMFLAHGSMFILLYQNAAPPDYIDTPYHAYRTLMDSD